MPILNRSLLRLLSWLSCCLFAAEMSSAAAQVQKAAVTLTPTEVVVGSPELIRVAVPATATLDGKWLGRKLEFFRGRSGQAWFALAGVDVEAAAGPSTLRITVRMQDGSMRDFSRSVEIHPSHYRTSTLTVAPRFVEPSPEQLKKIDAEIQLKKELFAVSAPRVLWAGDFRAPVRAAPTASFGTRRMFNGELASIHKGMDFRAATGTPVRASNSGVVVLARRLYFEGNCVIIDHGLGLFTIAMHLSRINVRVGQSVAKGTLLGLSGATGRVTGPHLHWAVRWEGAYLDPGKLLRLNLGAAR